VKVRFGAGHVIGARAVISKKTGAIEIGRSMAAARNPVKPNRRPYPETRGDAE